MQPKSKKTISIATIIIFIFSMFSVAVSLVLAQPTLTLNPNEGPSGTVVEVTGSGFGSGSRRVWFDTDGDSRYDYGETYKTVSGPAFTTTLTIPSVAPRIYNIRADSWPYTSPEASAPFTVVCLWDKLCEIEDMIDAIEEKLDGVGLSGSDGASATWSTDQQKVGRMSVLLDTGTDPVNGYAQVRYYVDMDFSSIADLSFWYMISSSSTPIDDINMAIQHPYWREGDTPTATGYFSPYFVLQIYDSSTGTRHWIISQQWAQSPGDENKWIQWKMTDSGQEYPPGSGMDPTEALWHMEGFLNDNPATGGSGGYPAGWEYFSYWQGLYSTYKIEQIKIGYGFFDGISERQIAYVDSPKINDIQKNLEPGLGNIKEEMLSLTDHALFDTTYPNEIGAKCKSDKTFDFHIVARAYGGPATIRITFADDSYIDFPLVENGILSFTQAAGGTLGVDDELKVTVISGDAVGWISIRTENGATPQYDYDGDGIKDSFCMTIVE